MAPGKRKANAIGVLLIGLVGSGVIFKGASILYDAGIRLGQLESVRGGTINEAYYQSIGIYGQAYSIVAYGLAIVCLAITIAASVAIWPKTEGNRKEISPPESQDRKYWDV